MTAPDVWVAKDDGGDIIRAAAIAAVGRDYNGNITVRLSGGEHLTLVLDHAQDHTHTPPDFHRQLIKVIAELSDAAGPAIVRPAQDPDRGWRWITERL
jgi:hypothetical protein